MVASISGIYAALNYLTNFTNILSVTFLNDLFASRPALCYDFALHSGKETSIYP
jgi:hypothetical protein